MLQWNSKIYFFSSKKLQEDLTLLKIKTKRSEKQGNKHHSLNNCNPFCQMSWVTPSLNLRGSRQCFRTRYGGACWLNSRKNIRYVKREDNDVDGRTHTNIYIYIYISRAKRKKTILEQGGRNDSMMNDEWNMNIVWIMIKNW